MTRAHLVSRAPHPLLTAEQRSLLDDAYRSARLDANQRALHQPNTQPPLTCRYCGKNRPPMLASTIDGHAKCVVTPAFMRRVLDMLEAGTTIRDLAAAIAVSPKVVGAWSRAALEARAAERMAVAP